MDYTVIHAMLPPLDSWLYEVREPMPVTPEAIMQKYWEAAEGERLALLRATMAAGRRLELAALRRNDAAAEVTERERPTGARGRSREWMS